MKFIKIIFFSLLFLSLIHGYKNTLDYYSYEMNYLNHWKQFEIGFELFISFFRSFGYSFDIVWIILMAVLTFFLALIFWKNHLFFLAAPNLVMLSNGFLNTQLRYALCISIFFWIYQKYLSKANWLNFIVLLVPSSFQLSGIYFFGLAIFTRRIKDSFNLLNFKSFIFLFFFVITLNYIVSQLDNLFDILNYSHYIDSKYSAGKSWVSILYVLITVGLCLIFLRKRFSYIYRGEICLILLVAISALVFSESSVISGRLTKFILLFEPFILHAIFNTIGYKRENMVFIICTLLLFFSKTFFYVYV